jgi:carboxyl-terminal processing protease
MSLYAGRPYGYSLPLRTPAPWLASLQMSGTKAATPLGIPLAHAKGPFFMTKPKLMGLVTGLMLALCAAMPVRGSDAPSAAPHAYAVVIGISQYGDKQIKPRPHAEADAKALYDVFANKDYLGLDADHARLLLGSDDPARKSQPATQENILKAVHWVTSKANTDDLVLFVFIGQGAPVSDSGNLLGYLASNSTLKDRAKTAVAAADLAQEFDKLRTHRFCAFIDVNFTGFEKKPVTVPEPSLGNGAYKEFRGSDGSEEKLPPPGRAIFLATNGLSPSLDLDKHGLFTQVILNGLKGAADKEGFEPDGVVTVEELSEYFEKELPELARQNGKTDKEKVQKPYVMENRSSHFVLTRNPSVAPKFEARLAKLDELAKEQKISSELTEEGRKLLKRMPKLKAQQDLRRDYEQLVDGQLALQDFTKERDNILKGMKLKRASAFEYASKVIQSTQILRDNYVKEVKQGDLVAWAIKGLYRQLEEKVPPDIRDRLDKVHDLSEPELTALLADVREGLGQREDLENHKDLAISLQRMTFHHLDPYTTYIDPETLSRFQQDTTGRFRGVGISIRENLAKGYLQVVTPLKGSPAYRAGIKTGDLIPTITRLVDDEGNSLEKPEVISTHGMTSTEAIKKIQGKPGTKIKLTIEREGVDKPLEFELAREVIELETVTGYNRKDNDEWNYYIDPSTKICYVRVTTFARNTARDLHKALSKLDKQGVAGFILDLRFNPGGLLTSAVEISDMFIDDGLIVTIRPRIGKEAPYVGEHDGSYLNFPMVCLVNGLSASGSEIVAACLQDHKRAVIMGERSYGKGSVQNIQPFEGGELKLTTASFWRPSGKNLNKSSTQGRDEDTWGVTPNKGFNLALSEKERDQLYEHQRDSEIIPRRDLPPKEKTTEFKDRQLEMALDYLRGQIKTASKVMTKRP